MERTEEFQAIIASLLETQNFNAVIEKYEELQKASSFQATQVPPTFFVTELFALFLTDRLPEAKLLWKRIPDEVKKSAGKNSELNATWELGKSIWTKNYIETHRNLAFNWRTSADLAGLLKDHFTNKMVALIGKAYTKIRADKAANMLGIIPSHLPEFVAEKGWALEGDFVLPKTATTADQRELTTESISNITAMVNFLEKRHHVFN